MAMVPAIKKTMESLIFEVKLMLENNDASAAFWLGNLKHRNLAGEEISSELPQISEDEIEQHPTDEEENGEVHGADRGKSSEKRARSGTKRKANGKSTGTSTKKKPTTSKSKGKSSKAIRESKTLGGADMDRDDPDRRIHTKRLANALMLPL